MQFCDIYPGRKFDASRSNKSTFKYKVRCTCLLNFKRDSFKFQIKRPVLKLKSEVDPKVSFSQLTRFCKNKKYYPYLPLWPCRKILADQLSGSGPFDNYVTPEECL